jgi:hypothetical protein
MKKYEIEYRLNNGDVCNKVFEGKNKTDAIKNYNHTTGIPKSKIIYVEDITELLDEDININIEGNKKMNKKDKIYVVLNEDRGGDTFVTIHRGYKSAKKRFDEIIKELLEINRINKVLKDNFWNLSKKHLRYDFGDNWGNVRIIEEGEDN